jgi:hypothetical protein
MAKQHTVTLSEETWIGLLIHLKETVDRIPVSTIEPDPWECVTKTIDAIEEFVSVDD